MATFRISWQTPDGEKTDWIWAKDLEEAKWVAIGREHEAIDPVGRAGRLIAMRSYTNAPPPRSALANAYYHYDCRQAPFSWSIQQDPKSWKQPLSRNLFG